MNMPANGQITQAMLRMRTPLARVELAASRLIRDATTPGARSLAAGISQAVRQIDEEISDSLRVLQPDSSRRSEIGDCRPCVPALRERMAAVLTAQEIDWRRQAEDDGEEPILGDRTAVDQAALVMLRAGIALAGRGGAIRLDLLENTEHAYCGLRLVTRQSSESPPVEIPDCDPLDPPRTLANRCGGALEVDRQEREITATFWLAPAVPS